MYLREQQQACKSGLRALMPMLRNDQHDVGQQAVVRADPWDALQWTSETRQSLEQ